MDLKDYLKKKGYSMDEYLDTYNDDIPSFYARIGVLEELRVQEDILGRNHLVGCLRASARRINAREAKVMCLDVHMGICHMSKDERNILYYFEGNVSKKEGQDLLRAIGRPIRADLTIGEFLYRDEQPVASLILVGAHIPGFSTAHAGYKK